MRIPLFTFWLSLPWILAACIDNPENDPVKGGTDSASDPVKIAAAYPDSALAQEQLIQYYRDSGQYGKAMAHASWMINKDSANPRWPYILATLTFENGDTARAIEILDQSVSKRPDRSSMILLGSLYARRGDSKALALAELLRQPIFQANTESYFITGTYWQTLGDKEKAIFAFENSIKESYTFMEAYREKAILLIELGRHAEALEVLNKAVTARNDFEEGYYFKGVCLEKMGRKEEAGEAYRMALMYDADYEEARRALEQLR